MCGRVELFFITRSLTIIVQINQISLLNVIAMHISICISQRISCTITNTVQIMFGRFRRFEKKLVASVIIDGVPSRVTDSNRFAKRRRDWSEKAIVRCLNVYLIDIGRRVRNASKNNVGFSANNEIRPAYRRRFSTFDRHTRTHGLTRVSRLIADTGPC